MKNQAVIAEMKAHCSLVDLCDKGFWFCRACQHVTRLDTSHWFNRCAICQSPRVKFCPPAFLPDATVKLTPELNLTEL